MKPLGPAVLLTARPRARLFHLVFGSHIGRALGADSGEKSGLASDIDTATVESLNALDPKRPIREAASRATSTLRLWKKRFRSLTPGRLPHGRLLHLSAINFGHR